MIGGEIKRVCPYCTQEFYPGECRVVSGIDGSEIDPAPQTWMQRMRARRNPMPLLGPKYTRRLAARECPNPNCRKLLPHNIESVDMRSIVVLGDIFSGKSHYLAALIRQIEDGQIRNPNGRISFMCLTPDVLRKYDSYYIDTLFNKKQQLDATQPETIRDKPKEPLIFELSVRKSLDHPPRKINLVFYDASGEDYADPTRLVIFSTYVLSASAIIFLADPISMPNILNSLPDHLQNQPVTGRRASFVLSQAIDLLERDRGFSLRNIPIAVALSKSDLLKILKRATERYHFLTNPAGNYSSGVDLKDLQVVDAEVRKLLETYGDQALIDATQTWDVQFFAVSATGNAPDPNGLYPAVTPIRCLDPVLWILLKLGIIEPYMG